jgi:hypothetical protein
MSFGWWTILDTHRKLEYKKPSSIAVLDTNWCTWHLLQYPVQKALAHSHSKWKTYAIHVSRLKNPYITCLLPFISTD